MKNKCHSCDQRDEIYKINIVLNKFKFSPKAKKRGL